MELYDMVWTLNESSQENLLNTDTIYVQTGKKSFVIEKEGMMHNSHEHLCWKKMHIWIHLAQMNLRYSWLYI